jgi:type IV secretory pathway TraG/TraD family ATPase VirD4
MAETPSINALPGQGVNLEKVIEEGGCVYIVGSMRNDIVKTVQRMLLVRLIQLAERRDRMKGGIRPVCIVLDEVKYHLSKPAQEALGAARDKGVHVILAHQSLGDLRDCTKDMNPDAVVDAIVENCWYKLCYRVMNPDTAEWLARMSGTIQVDDESRTVIRNLMQAEIVTPERTIRQNERHLVDVNMLMSLAPGVGVLYGNGLPQFVSIRPIPTTKTKEAITPIIVDGTEVESGEDAIGI